MNATTVAVDLAKSVFQLAVADASWRVVETHRLTRTQFERWFANRDVSLVIMESCGSAHHWARWLNGLGIEVRLLPAQYVRAYVKRNKTDAADAAALLEAARASDMRPVRVGSADLHEMMRNFCDRFRSESKIATELIMESIGAEASDRLCRELFQIYREALHNIKKHAGATHVVVKLRQDEAKVCLMVDDNGKGFSFAGRFTSDELDRLRLGPISIKERTRSMGGMLTVESNPGHGARLIVEVPLS